MKEINRGITMKIHFQGLDTAWCQLMNDHHDTRQKLPCINSLFSYNVTCFFAFMASVLPIYSIICIPFFAAPCTRFTLGIKPWRADFSQWTRVELWVLQTLEAMNGSICSHRSGSRIWLFYLEGLVDFWASIRGSRPRRCDIWLKIVIGSPPQWEDGISTTRRRIMWCS